MSHDTALAPANGGLILQLLAWIADRPRGYAETLDAWRTSCPRLPVWEDAVDHGLLRVVPRDRAAQRAASVELTAAGAAWLARHGG